MISLVVYKRLVLGIPKLAFMRLLMVDRTVKKLIGIFCDVLVKVFSFIFPVDFVTLFYEVDFDITNIFERPF